MLLNNFSVHIFNLLKLLEYIYIPNICMCVYEYIYIYIHTHYVCMYNICGLQYIYLYICRNCDLLQTFCTQLVSRVYY